MEEPLRFYSTHSRWSDPAPHGALVREIRPAPDTMASLVSGLVLHAWLAKMRGIELSASAVGDYWRGREVREIIDLLLIRDGSPLTRQRVPENRFFGCCRYYALVAAAIFREHGVPARLRAGFAAYFVPGFLEDHWVCEYWHDGGWRLLDAQLDETTVADFRIGFSPSDVPRTQFIDASTAWSLLREGKIDPAKTGLSAVGIQGMWFAAGSVFRDIAALNKEEMLPWDAWSLGRELAPGQDLPARTAEFLDRVSGLLKGAPDGDLARRVYRENAWLRVTPKIFSLPDGDSPDGPTEIDLMESRS